MRAHDLPLLSAPFATSDVEWKPGATTRDKTKGLAMAYLTSRAVQDRLDAVCGPADWRNEYRPGPDGGVICGISVYVDRGDGSAPEWVTKWDGADNTDVEAVKGGLSGSMKRAAVMWGIGRTLYGLPAQWVRLDERGRFAEPPRLPREYGAGNGPGQTGAAQPSAPARPSAPAQERAEAPRQAGPSARPEGARPEAQRTAPAAVGQAGTRRIIRPASGRPGEGDGGSRGAEPGF